VPAAGERVWARLWPVLAGDAAMAVGVIRAEVANAAAIAVDTSRFRMTYLRMNTSEEAMNRTPIDRLVTKIRCFERALYPF
jgi:hypothetical protein